MATRLRHKVNSIASTAVAIQPSQCRRAPVTWVPMVTRRKASSIMTVKMGTAITPLRTADREHAGADDAQAEHTYP